MAETATPLLALRGIRHTYGTGETAVEVLHGIDLALREGEFTALIGPSGSGKSTLLNLIGLLETPTQGEVLIDGTATATLDDNARTALRNRALGFVFQFHHLLPAFSALENVLMPVLVHDRYADAAARADASALLAEVGLDAFAHRRPAQLSGGQQQRVAIARALANRPRLVLADEPTGNLDTHTADEIFALFRRINAERKLTFLIVTHDARLAARCDRVIRLVDGQVVDERSAIG
ncbi:MAG: ABC transporter ATP-binding protein [Gammaproteobacteria bacterium]